MVHPEYRHRGLAQQLLAEVDHTYPDKIKELYTCTKSWINIRLYEKMGYRSFKELKGGCRTNLVSTMPFSFEKI